MADWRTLFGTAKDWRRDLGIALSVGLFLSFIGPFGSYASPLRERLIYCMAIGLGGGLTYFPLLRAGIRLAQRADLSIWLAALPAGAMATVPVTLLATVLGPVVWPGDFPAHFGVIYSQMLMINLPFTMAVLVLMKLFAPAAPQAAAIAMSGPAAPARPRLLDRLPPRMGADILALQAEDHYVRVHTPNGSTLLLMRLADAIAELDGLDGLRVHRSWWVAKGAVAGSTRTGRRVDLRLTNGVDAPVTRENVPLLRQAGWV